LLLDRPEFYGIESVLLPATLVLHHEAATRSLPSVTALRERMLQLLRQRIAEPLEVPTDWRRDNRLSCSCRRCTPLAAFLEAPDQAQWSYKASQVERDHVAATIHQSRADLSCTTDKQRRPYSLVCTKTKASYDRREQQRKYDLEHLARLEMID